MKGIYLSNIDPAKAKGYEAKILGQIEGFNRLGVDIDLICFTSDNRVVLKQYFINEINIKEYTLSSFFNNLLIKRISLYRNTLTIIKQNNPDFLYLRHPRSDPLYINFLKSVKKYNPYLVIISEIPTYPYDREYINCNSIKDKLLIFLDKATRNKLKHYIDRIVVIAYNGDVFGISSINITNGINTSRIKQITTTKSIDRELHLIGVGNVDFWHGYDRVIRGLREYYEKNHYSNQIKVIFNIISPHRETIAQLQHLTTELHLSDYVIFHGAKHGKELDDIFEKCHLAIGTIANHRLNLNSLSPLKAREYTARGVPFVSSYEDIDFSPDFPYILQIKANEEPVEIEKIINFIKKLNKEINHHESIRKYAEDYLDWSIKIEKVVNYIENYLVTDKKRD